MLHQHRPGYHARMIDVHLPSKQGKQFAKTQTPQAAHVVTLSRMAMEVAHQGTMCLTLCTSTRSWEMNRLPIHPPLSFSGTVSLESILLNPLSDNENFPIMIDNHLLRTRRNLARVVQQLCQVRLLT
jgi:hypothetical protein